MYDPFFNNYMGLKRRYEQCNKTLLNEIFGFLQKIMNMDVALEVFEGSIYAHMFDLIKSCMDGNDSLAEFVLHKIASDTCNEIATHAISAIPWHWTRDTTAVYLLRHSLFNNVRRFMPCNDPSSSICILNNLSGSISDNVKQPLTHYYREYCRAARDKRRLEIPATCFEATVKYINVIPQVAALGESIARNAFYKSNLFADSSARVIFPMPQYHISRLPSQHVGEMSSLLARHFVMDSVEAQLYSGQN